MLTDLIPPGPIIAFIRKDALRLREVLGGADRAYEPKVLTEKFTVSKRGMSRNEFKDGYIRAQDVLKRRHKTLEQQTFYRWVCADVDISLDESADRFDEYTVIITATFIVLAKRNDEDGEIDMSLYQIT